MALAVTASADLSEQRTAQIAAMPGLVAFWTFGNPQDGVWRSVGNVSEATNYPLYLRKIGDATRYTLNTWPYTDEASKIRVDNTGPFGHALYFNQGHIYAESPRAGFDNGPLDLNGTTPFTMVAWMKFTGVRHMVAGIWDEGGWDKYRGRRQAALFGGLFGRNGITAHISASGASSYPQSTVSGSQYARERAIDGADFANGQWVCMAMTYDPASQEVKAWLNGVATPLDLGDPVENDVFNHANPKQANPYLFKWPIYSPRRFILKYNGYNVRTAGIYEHWLDVDAQAGTFTYGRSAPGTVTQRFKVTVTVQRNGTPLSGLPLEAEVAPGDVLALPAGTTVVQGDEIITALAVWQNEAWAAVGPTLTYPVPEGAPFTLGRALGLGSEEIAHGSQLYMDGVAVFNRVLSPTELRTVSFLPALPAGAVSATAPKQLGRIVFGTP